MVAHYADDMNNIRLKTLEYIIWGEKKAFEAGAINYGFSYRRDYLDAAMACTCLLYTSISGELYIKGEKVNLKNPHDAIRHGLAYVTEDRKTNGLILGESIRFNTTLARLSKVCEKGVVNTDMEVHLADEMTKEMGTKTPSNEQKIGNLSGGNQQKALLGKWMFTEPDILILDEPTRGIDVGAKYDIYCLINKMVEDGKSVIMISSEMPELLGMCDRIYVMSEGRLAGEFTAEEATQERIMASIMQEQNKK